MSSILYTGGMILLWVINLLNGTGIGAAYHTTEYARIAALVVALALFIRDGYRQRGWYAPARYFRVLLPMVTLFFMVSLLRGYGTMSLEYLWVFLVTYILSHTRPNRRILYMVGIAYAVLGLAILFIFNYMDTLDGWNPNSIAMIGLFSYVVFAMPFYGARDKQSIIALSLVGAAYVFLIWPTEARSCIISIILALLIVFRVIPFEKMFRSAKSVYTALHVPVMIALFGCLLAATADMELLNAWSVDEFGKTLFSGRDTTWLGALSEIGKNLLFGGGRVDSGTYHNSAIACLVAYGLVGYGLWIGLFYVILKEALPYRRDICIAGSLAAFFVIFWQQSVELGLFSAAPNLIPYIVLGVLLARIRTMKEQP